MKADVRVLVLASSLALMMPFPCGAFEDPLELPARTSALAPKAPLNGVALAGNRLVAVGQRGFILYSDNSGVTWTQSSSVPVSSDLTAVYFFSPQKGWAVGHDGVVLSSNDRGETWVKQLDGRAAVQIMKNYYAAYSPVGMPGGAEAFKQLQEDVHRFVEEGPDKPFIDVWFENELTGYVVGCFNFIFKTTDGGKNWIPWFDRTDNPRRLHFNAIHAVDGDIYLAGEQGMVLRLDKAAMRFRATPVDYKGTFFGLTDNGSSVFAFGLRGNLFRSDDRGVHWQKVDTGITAAITAEARTNDGRIVLVSESGHVLLSTDGGKTFNQVRVDRVPTSDVIALAP